MYHVYLTAEARLNLFVHVGRVAQSGHIICVYSRTKERKPSLRRVLSIYVTSHGRLANCRIHNFSPTLKFSTGGDPTFESGRKRQHLVVYAND